MTVLHTPCWHLLPFPFSGTSSYHALPQCSCSLLIHYQGRTLYVYLSNFSHFSFTFPSCISINISFLVVMFLKQWLCTPIWILHSFSSCRSHLIPSHRYGCISPSVYLWELLAFFYLAHFQSLFISFPLQFIRYGVLIYSQ